MKRLRMALLGLLLLVGAVGAVSHVAYGGDPGPICDPADPDCH